MVRLPGEPGQAPTEPECPRPGVGSAYLHPGGEPSDLIARPFDQRPSRVQPPSEPFPDAGDLCLRILTQHVEGVHQDRSHPSGQRQLEASSCEPQPREFSKGRGRRDPLRVDL